jgi:hypothetical protein
MSEHDLREPGDIEQRLRTAFRAVAELPGPVPRAAPAGRGRQDTARRRPPRRLLVTVVSVAALALVVALALTFGPHSSAPRGAHGPGSAPATHSTSTTSTTSTTPGPHAAPVLRTRQVTYQPFSGTRLKRNLHVAAHRSGTCFAYDGGTGDKYLYRCGTMQPCVAGSQGTKAPLACPVGGDPTSHDVVLWTVTSLGTTAEPATPKFPFAMQLSNGPVCVLINAAWSGLGPYSCSHPGGGGTPSAATIPADCHRPVVGTPFWAAQCQDQLTQTSPFTSTTVVKLWF